MRFASTTTVTIVLAAGLASATPMRRQTSAMAPCANITELFNQAVEANETDAFVVDGQLAYDCLMSMPFDAELGSAYVAEVTKYLQFQSTIPQLKNPPSTYLSQPVDLLGGMAEIYQKANSSQYQSQHELDTDMNTLLFSANDGHLNAGFCSLSAFSFGIRFTLYSISEDGVSLPDLYLSTDVLAGEGGANVSQVVQINGQNATEYLENLGLIQQNQDPDAQYNDMFPSQARLVGNGATPQGAFTFNNGFWPGTPEITLTFANGSSVSRRVLASVNSAFNYTDGEELFASYCLPVNSTSSSGNGTSTSDEAAATSSVLPTATAGPAGYPEPVIRDPYNKIIGYYVNDTAFNDTAVLFVPNFSTQGEGLPDDEEATFSQVASDFVNGAVADGKTKMVIDISGNPGGTILSGFDLFKLFFPDLAAYSATRMRDHDAARLTIQAFSAATPNDTDITVDNPFYYGTQVTPDQNSSFASWEDFYGPDVIDGANMTNLYANFNLTSESDESQPIRGYGGVPLNVTGRPFAAENIIIVSDGYCTSTCTTFVNLMTHPQFGGVRSVAFGGRPINAPMQVMGGVRGAQSMEWTNLQSYFTGTGYQLASNLTEAGTPIWGVEEFTLAENVLPINIKSFPLQLFGGNLNLRNSYNPDDDELPLQFAYQAADCKLFYTLNNIEYPATTWVSAANAVWGNGTCVPGSTSTNSTAH